MIINRPTPDRGICFAWTPKWTPDGTVWLEWVHYRRVEDAYDTRQWRYARWVPEARYDKGERAFAIKPVRPCTCPDNMAGHEAACRFSPPAYFDYEVANGRVIPPNVSKCGERNTNDPCRYPKCTCMNIGGSTCPT
jgi:hypothetical protein